MKRILVLTVALIALMTGCGQKEVAENQAAGALNVAILSADDKYAHTTDGTLEGIEPLLAKSAAENAGRELNLTTVENESDLYSKIQDGSVDLAFGRLSETKDEIKPFLVSRNYGKSGVYFLTKKYDFTDNLALLQSGKIGIMKSVKPLTDDLAGVGNFTVSDYSKAEELGRDVTSGKVDIGLVNEREALSLIVKSENLQVQEALNGPMEYYVAIMKNDPSLKSAVDSAISAYYESMLKPSEEETD